MYTFAMFKFLYCLLVVTIQYGDISGQPEDAQQINQHFYNNIHKLISSKFDNKVESEVNFFRWIIWFGQTLKVSCLFAAFFPRRIRGKYIGEATTSERSNQLAEY